MKSVAHASHFVWDLLAENPLTWARIRHVLKVVLLALALPAVVMAAAVIVAERSGFVISSLVRDPASILDVSPFTGMFSSLGVLMWGAAATVCYFGWAILRRQPGQSEEAGLFLWGALLTSLLCLDDLFLFHEEVFWELLRIGEKQFYLAYLLLGAFGVIRYYKVLLRSEYLYLAVAVGLMALSTGMDALRDPVAPWEHLLEEAPKWLGICAWLLFWGGHFYHTLLDQMD